MLGLLNKQIAAELKTAEKTIKVHRGRVMQKLGITSVPDLVRLSQNAGVSPAEMSHGAKVHCTGRTIPADREDPIRGRLPCNRPSLRFIKPSTTRSFSLSCANDIIPRQRQDALMVSSLVISRQ